MSKPRESSTPENPTAFEPENEGGAVLPVLGRYDAAHLERYRYAVSKHPGGPIIDFGCGFGFGSALMASMTPEQCIGMEVDSRALDYCVSHYLMPNIKFIKPDQGRFPVSDRSIGMITCFEVIEHLYPNQLSTFLAESRRVLRRHGVIIGSTPNASESSRVSNPYHVQEYDPRALTSLFATAGYELELSGQGQRARGSSDRLSVKLLSLVPPSVAASVLFRQIFSLATVTLSARQVAKGSAVIGPFHENSSAHIVFLARDLEGPAAGSQSVSPGVRPIESALASR